MKRLWRSIKCHLRRHDWALGKINPGLYVVEKCRNCPAQRTRLVRR